MRMTRKEFLQMAGAGWISERALEALPLFRKRESFEAVPLSQNEDLAPIYRHLERNRDAHIENLRDFILQPSVSATGEGIRECAAMVGEFMRSIGCEGIELVETDGHPMVFGVCDVGAPKTLLNYGMYDVQPIHEPDRWMSPPEQARVVDYANLGKAIVARGSFNTKGPLRAFFNACESILAVTGTLPVNLMFTIEGEEEQGSTHLEQALRKKQSEIQKGDACYFAFSQQDPEGEILMHLGCKGEVYMELEASGANWGRGPEEKAIHSSNAAIVESPAWRLVDALSTMASDNGMHIEMDGYYDNVAPPSEDDKELIRELLPRLDMEAWKKTWSVSHFYEDLSGEELLNRYLYATTWNILGIWGGYTGPGLATILPHKATAKMGSRIVPNQTAAEVFSRVRRHLDDHGYTDIEIRKISSNEWAKTSPREPAVQALVGIYESYGVKPMIMPHAAGTAPDHLYSRTLFNMPFVRGGMGHGGNLHTVDEYYVVEGKGKIAGITEVERFFVDFLYAYAAL
jgi:acetylornithine deacetylase/succinyl-diaminopimelate desuccinylase-like protein